MSLDHVDLVNYQFILISPPIVVLDKTSLPWLLPQAPHECALKLIWKENLKDLCKSNDFKFAFCLGLVYVILPCFLLYNTGKYIVYNEI